MKKILPILALLNFASCVGTVQDENLETTKAAVAEEQIIEFAGIVDAKAISDSRVAIFFNAAPGNPSDLTYQIRVNNSQNPINVRGDSLKAGPTGQYYFTIRDLSPATKYGFNVDVIDADGSKGEGALNIYATTFSNKTCEFEGISSVSVPAGSGGKNSLVLSWVPAVKRSSGIGSANIQDPYKYVIYKINADEGVQNLFNDSYNSAGKDIKEILAKDATSYTYPGLQPGKQYYFGVRCIHEGYRTNDKLLIEKNLKIVSQSTRDASAIFDWQASSLKLITPGGRDGESSRTLTWDSATGDFYNYRLYYEGYNSDPSLIADPFIDTTLTVGNTLTYKSIEPEDNSLNFNFGDANKYKFYHLKLIACGSEDCLEGERIGVDSTNLITEQLYPKISPFQGIQKIESPRSDTAVDSIWLKAEAPSLSEGYAHRLNVYCLKDGSDKSTRFKNRPDGTFGVGGDDRGNCADLTVSGTIPTTEPLLNSFTELEIQGAKTDGSTYCFMLIPVLENTSPAYYYEDLDNASVKCITPEIVTPKIYEFTGKDNCSLVGTSSSELDVNWTKPSGGIYSGYYVYYKDETVGATFNFSEAIKAQEDIDTTVYKTPVDIADQDILEARLSDLVPGHSYEIGVLTYVDIAGVKKFSESNLNTYSCRVPLPKYTFNEWTGVLALGPKTNELYPNNMNAYFVQESLDIINRPFEVGMMESGSPVDFDEEASNSTPTFGLDGEYVKGDLYGSTDEFNGAFGSTTNSSVMSTPLRYSNTGIIKFMFKDVSISVDGTTANISDYAINTIGLPVSKKDRKYGYKVLRSEDNGASWIDITKGNFAYQSLSNEGLVVGKLVPKERANPGEDSLPGGNEWVVEFTDYSVQAERISSEYTERARVYQYKVIPIFDNKEIEMESSSNNFSHNVIKITLPPPNMALVHRWMANRTWCREVGRNPSTEYGLNYTCSFNGLGSQGVNFPWRVGQTVVDLGGDLLVDRFELGCNFTRGDTNQDSTLNTSTFVGTQRNFEGLNSSLSTEFQGCYYDETGNSGHNNLISQSTKDSGGDTGTRYNQVVRGDCLGDGRSLQIATNKCESSAQEYTYPSYYPGNVQKPGVCQLYTKSGNDGTTAYNYEENSVQSLFGGIFYQRWKYPGLWHTAGNPIYTAPSGGELFTESAANNNCMINLPYINGDGKYRPRWLGSSSMMMGVQNTGTGNNHILYDKTVGDILSNSDLYNLTDYQAPPVPSYLTANMPVSRIFASNGSGLPLLDGMDQNSAHNLCSTFDIEVGIKVGSDSFAPLGDKKSKRLLRRKEYVAASGWHESLPERNSVQPYNHIDNEGTILQTEALECNSYYKGVDAVWGGGNVGEIGEKINSNFGYYGENYTNVPLISGSGVGTGPGHSAKCVSKYGVQDLIGNATERVSDQLFCFTGERIMYNKVSSGLDSNSDEWNFYPEGWIEEALYDSIHKTPFRDTTNSGRCSVNEEGASRAYNPVISGTSIINSIFTEMGSKDVNPLVVPRVKSFDVESLNQARNGDGTFLDFGNDRLGPNLSDPGTLGDGQYFNHLLGLPLQCSGTSCDDTPDNKMINISSTFDISGKTLSTVNGVSFADSTIYSFGLGNSGFDNTGTLETSQEGRDFDPATMGAGRAFDYISDLTQNGDGSWTTTVENTLDDGSLVETMRAYFVIPRSGATLSIPSGGSVYETRAGRYTANIKQVNGSNIRRILRTGLAGRCSVLINEN